MGRNWNLRHELGQRGPLGNTPSFQILNANSPFRFRNKGILEARTYVLELTLSYMIILNVGTLLSFLQQWNTVMSPFS